MAKPKIFLRGIKGISLLETIFYLASLTVILNLGTCYLFQIQKAHKNQQDCLNQTVKATIAGRKIKDDIENCIAIENSCGRFSASKNQLVIKNPEQIIIYQLDKENLCRLSITGNEIETSRIILEGVESFSFLKNSEGGVSFMEVNLRLKKNSKKGRLEPLFTFKAIPGVSSYGKR